MEFEVALVGGTLGDEPLEVKIIRNGAELQTFTMDEVRVLNFKDTPEVGDRTYYRVEIRGTVPPYPEVPNAALVAGDLMAISNPIYFNFDPDFKVDCRQRGCASKRSKRREFVTTSREHQACHRYQS